MGWDKEREKGRYEDEAKGGIEINSNERVEKENRKKYGWKGGVEEKGKTEEK